MGDWYALELGDPLIASVTLAEIREEFAATISAEADASCAVFTRRDAGDLHCRVTAYFSPGADGLARRYGAHVCAQPGRRGLELLAATEAGLDLFARAKG